VFTQETSRKKITWKKLKERDNSEDLGVDRRVILKLILNKWTRGVD
jgi:hypothetical protein